MQPCPGLSCGPLEQAANVAVATAHRFFEAVVDVHALMRRYVKHAAQQLLPELQALQGVRWEPDGPECRLCAAQSAAERQLLQTP